LFTLGGHILRDQRFQIGDYCSYDATRLQYPVTLAEEKSRVGEMQVLQEM
jgi:hypothetical protein